MEQIKSTSTIAILMATYNGEKYLGEQIDSLLAQTYKDWHLYIHDDGSTDNTNAILQEYAQKHSNIHVLEYESQRGAMRNFLSLLQRVEADYYMFCDQDDVWLKEKVELSFEEMKRQEAACQGKPIIVYTDLYVTDAIPFGRRSVCIRNLLLPLTRWQPRLLLQDAPCSSTNKSKTTSCSPRHTQRCMMPGLRHVH